MKKIYLLLTSTLLLFLTSCSTIPPADFTLQEIPSVSKKDAEMVSITVGYEAKKRGMKIETNHLVPPAWQTALEDAINRSLIFSDDQERKFSLSVRIYHFDLPAAGITMVSDCGAIYEVLDRNSGDVVFSERIYTSGSVPMNYDFVGVVRASESINRCARNNIRDFLISLDNRNL